MVSSSQIREQLANFLVGRISLDAFENWFAQNTWNIHKSGSVAAEDLTFAIEGSLSEFSSSHIDERELRAELFQILGSENKVVEFIEEPQVVYSFKSSAPATFVLVRP
jgi:hypothetical protein